MKFANEDNDLDLGNDEVQDMAHGETPDEILDAEDDNDEDLDDLDDEFESNDTGFDGDASSDDVDGDAGGADEI